MSSLSFSDCSLLRSSSAARLSADSSFEASSTEFRAGAGAGTLQLGALSVPRLFNLPGSAPGCAGFGAPQRGLRLRLASRLRRSRGGGTAADAPGRLSPAKAEARRLLRHAAGGSASASPGPTWGVAPGHQLLHQSAPGSAEPTVAFQPLAAGAATRVDGGISQGPAPPALSSIALPAVVAQQQLAPLMFAVRMATARAQACSPAFRNSRAATAMDVVRHFASGAGPAPADVFFLRATLRRGHSAALRRA